MNSQCLARCFKLLHRDDLQGFCSLLLPTSDPITMKIQALDPLISEFDTQDQAISHDRWFRAQVQAAIDDPRPSVPHDEAMAQVRATIQAAKHNKK